MSQKIVVLSPEDISLLRGLIQNERNRLRSPQRAFEPEPSLPTAPDIYVAKAPVGGIAGLDAEAGTGTGTGTLGFPGSAECEIYRRGYLGIYPKLIPTGKQQIVYNLSEASVPGGSWVLIERDKWGSWWAVPTAVGEIGDGGGSSGDGSTVTVQLDADLGSDTWRGYIQVPNGLGYTVGDQVRVWVGRHTSVSGYTPNWLVGQVLLCQVTPFTSSGFTVVFPQRIENLANLTTNGLVSNTTQSFGGGKHFGASEISFGGANYGDGRAFVGGTTSGGGNYQGFMEAPSINTAYAGNLTLYLGVQDSFASGELYLHQENASLNNGSVNIAVDFENVKKTGQTNPGSVVSYPSLAALIDYSGTGTGMLTLLNMLFYGGVFCGLGNEYALTTEHIYHPTTAQSLKDFLDSL